MTLSPEPLCAALYFGTFNPIHWGHLLIAQCALEQFDLARVTFIPAGRSPFRRDEADMAAAADRLAMAQLAVADNPRLAVDAIEIARCADDPSQSSYTVDTLRALRARDAWPDAAPIPIIIGSDALAQVHRWREAQALIAMALFLQAPRPDFPPVTALWLEGRHQPLNTRMIDAPPNAISATRIRQALRAGRSARYLTPDVVLAYSRDQCLWRAR